MKKEKILIADDNPDMIYLIKKGFEQEGYSFIEASDGEETLEKIIDERPDLILLDLKMPRKSGMEVLKEIKKNKELKDIPVIILTVVSDVDERVKALGVGANDFLLKPPIPAELKARVNVHLELRNTTKVLRDYSDYLAKLVDQKTKEIKNYAGKLEEKVEEKVGMIRRQNEELLMNLKSAQVIQKSFLPRDFPPFPGIRFSAHYVPCEMVGGDFYDVFRIDEDTLGIVVADVSGHGVPSAMITVFLKQEIAYHSKNVMGTGNYYIRNPKELLKILNETFYNSNIGDGKYFVTLVYCTYSIGRRVLTCSMAGHHAFPLLKKKNGDIIVIEMEGFPVGWFKEGDEYFEKSYTLASGDMVILYTDGLFEVTSDRKKQKSKKRIEKTVIDKILKKDNIIDTTNKLIGERINKGKLKDDVTVLIMTIE